MKNFIVILVFSVFVVGCASTIDKEAALQNDINMQRETRENDELTADAVTAGTITETSATIAAERRHKARRLARAIARDAGNDHLPVIPSNMEEEPVE